MKTENSFDLDTPSYSLTVTVKPALLTFSLRYHLTNQNYTLEIPENKVAKIFKGGFSSINQLYVYLYESRELQDISLEVCINGKIIIKKPNILEEEEKQTEWESYQIQTLLVSTPPAKREQFNPMVDMKMEETQRGLPKIKMEESQQLSQFSHAPQQPMFFEIECITGDQTPSQIQKFQREQHLCYKAIKMLQKGHDVNQLAEKLNISIISAKKMNFQYNTKKKIVMPKGPRPQRQDQSQSDFNNHFPFALGAYQQYPHRQLPSPSDLEHYPNLTREDTRRPHQGQGSRLPNQTAERIRRLLFEIVKQGKIQSYEQMQQFLISKGIDRSLSSIYRYVAAIKSSYSQFKNKNYAMHKKDVNDYYIDEGRPFK